MFTFPGFINEDREVVFELGDWEEGAETIHLFRQGLTEDGFSARGEPLFFVPNSQYPLTFTLDSEALSEITAVEDRVETPQPAAFSLAQNYPNPFNAATHISYAVPSAVRVLLDIFNTHGQRVAAVDQGLRAPGTHTVSWTGVDGEGRPLASGVYFYRLRLPDGEREVEPQTRKMLLLR